jgi:hypothetical protein
MLNGTGRLTRLRSPRGNNRPRCRPDDRPNQPEEIAIPWIINRFAADSQPIRFAVGTGDIDKVADFQIELTGLKALNAGDFVL